MCSCGHTFGVSAIAAITSEVKSRGCGEVNRTRSSPSTEPHDTQQLRERAAVAELDAVGVDVLPEQGHLQHAVRGERGNLGEHVAGAPVLLLAAQRRDDAERAGVVAAHRDRHPARVGRLAARRQRRGEDLQRLGDLHLGARVVPGPLQQHRQRVHVVRAEHHVHPRRPADDLGPVLLRQAATDRDLHAGPGRLDRPQVAEVAVEPVVGVLPDRARVEDDDVGAVGVAPDVAGLLEQPRHPLGVVHVHLAPVGADGVAAGHRPSLGAVPRHRPGRAGCRTCRVRAGRSAAEPCCVRSACSERWRPSPAARPSFADTRLTAGHRSHGGRLLRRRHGAGRGLAATSSQLRTKPDRAVHAGLDRQPPAAHQRDRRPGLLPGRRGGRPAGPAPSGRPDRAARAGPDLRRHGARGDAGRRHRSARWASCAGPGSRSAARTRASTSSPSGCCWPPGWPRTGTCRRCSWASVRLRPRSPTVASTPSSGPARCPPRG